MEHKTYKKILNKALLSLRYAQQALNGELPNNLVKYDVEESISQLKAAVAEQAPEPPPEHAAEPRCHDGIGMIDLLPMMIIKPSRIPDHDWHIAFCCGHVTGREIGQWFDGLLKKHSEKTIRITILPKQGG